MIEKLPGWLVGVVMVFGGGLVGLWWAFTFIPHRGVEVNLAVGYKMFSTLDNSLDSGNNAISNLEVQRKLFKNC